MVSVAKIISGLGILGMLAVITLTIALSTGYAQIDFKTGKIVQEEHPPSSQFFITKEIANTLNKEYSSSTKEFAACMTTNQLVEQTQTLMKTSYALTGFDTDILFFGESFSTMNYCESGVIHSHPKGSCYFSIADIYSFKDRIKKGEYFSIIMCGIDQFYYITRNDFSEQPLPIKE
jgi:hypothetical protein